MKLIKKIHFIKHAFSPWYENTAFQSPRTRAVKYLAGREMRQAVLTGEAEHALGAGYDGHGDNNDNQKDDDNDGDNGSGSGFYKNKLNV